MRFWYGFFRDCWTLVVPLLLIIDVSIVLFLTGYSETAVALNSIGTAVVILGNIVYIIAFHSRKRWPGTTWSERLKRLFTFSR